ncbi:hypothetical protein PCHCB_000491000, partial [Plasmodium chabaudi chabaudi]
TIPNGIPSSVPGHDPNIGTSIPPTPINFNTNTPSTDNGSTNSGTDIKMSEKPSIWCIVTKKKCDVVGIGIIVISTLIMISIMYKYLSFGWGKKTTKKRNMRKVINLVESKKTEKTVTNSVTGKKTLQIIISSSSQKKQTKKSINSVNEKIPLLNIYKLMQADPAPFINLFFLLIFFVYKRKDNSIE